MLLRQDVAENECSKEASDGKDVEEEKCRREANDDESLVKNETDADKADDDVTEKTKEKRKIGCNNDEVLAVLAHELGHWKLSHNLKNLVIGQVTHLSAFLLPNLMTCV